MNFSVKFDKCVYIRNNEKYNAVINIIIDDNSASITIEGIKHDLTNYLYYDVCKYQCINILSSLLCFRFTEDSYFDSLDIGKYSKQITLNNNEKIILECGEFYIISDGYIKFYYEYPAHEKYINPFNFIRKLYMTMIIVEEFPSINKNLLSCHLLTNKHIYSDFDNDTKLLARKNTKHNHKLYMEELLKHIADMDIDLDKFMYSINVGNDRLPKVIWNIVNSYMETR